MPNCQTALGTSLSSPGGSGVDDDIAAGKLDMLLGKAPSTSTVVEVAARTLEVLVDVVLAAASAVDDVAAGMLDVLLCMARSTSTVVDVADVAASMMEEPMDITPDTAGVVDDKAAGRLEILLGNGGWQDLCAEIHPSFFSLPASPARNQHFCLLSSAPQTQNSHPGSEKHTFEHVSIFVATNLSELMQLSKRQPVLAPKPRKFAYKACPACPMAVSCWRHVGHSGATVANAEARALRATTTMTAAQRHAMAGFLSCSCWKG
eukprot:CAMPEP_0115328574 /NCGR_PEP_ID=MMETSP0270-20121206/84755_1 /TAXON_ID=71861 /ORGANISM="Scrippsiella trochoidea, Strain CCMP3099" /LENGTH=261 /DNA_ID=CAMNT_0002749109 /DNA_START=466 /DNA_END=1247 /DNA_ORIENTATION=+